MAEVFISYKRERRPAARHLEQILIRYGYTVWFDLALVRGHDYETQIERELAAAKAVIVLWCGLSVQSPGVRSEASRAKSQDKLVPLVIEPCQLPLFSTLEQNIDLTAAAGSPRDHALDAVLDDLERLVGRAPLPDYKALRDYEATWRGMTGGLSFARLPLEPVAAPEIEIGGETGASGGASAAASPGHDYGFWERQWDRQGEGSNLVALSAIADEAPRYFADQARARIAAIEAERQRAEAERRDQAERQRAEETVARQRQAAEARYKAEGRVHIQAPHVHGAPDGWFLPGNGRTEWFRDLADGPEMVVVPAGRFRMGSPAGTGADRERPDREVTIARPFAVGLAPVTRGQFAAFVAATQRDMSGGAYGWTGTEWKHDAGYSWNNPGFAQGDDHPVVCVHWLDAVDYAQWLAKATSQPYRLLSEAEWEYACRATTTTAYNTGDAITRAQANFGSNEKGTTPVRKYPPNLWGLSDMHGNVWEWCQEYRHPVSVADQSGLWRPLAVQPCRQSDTSTQGRRRADLLGCAGDHPARPFRQRPGAPEGAESSDRTAACRHRADPADRSGIL